MHDQQSFLKTHAEKYGLRESVILHTIIFFVLLNEKQNRNKREGKYWTYNSAKGWIPYFPFLTEQQIARTFRSLSKQGALTVSNYNKKRYDKTKWFTLSPGLYREVKRSYYWKRVVSNIRTASIKTDQPIPDINIINIKPYV